MALIDVAKAAADPDLRQRIAACIAGQTDTGLGQPLALADQHMWRICAEPGWGDAYASALAANVERPGLDGAVISDAMILAAVQKHLAPQGASEA